MCKKIVYVHLASRRLSAQNISIVAMGMMVVLIGVMYLLAGVDRALAAQVAMLAAFFSLMISGIAVMFIPADFPLMRNIGYVIGVLLSGMSFVICLFLLRMILQST